MERLSQSTLPKNLVIQYTTDLIPLTSRSWNNVSNLVNGYYGIELLDATAVNPDGTVIEDLHDSIHEDDGWASLSFDPVQATGIRISFSKTPGTTYPYIHYKVYEIEAHADAEQYSLSISDPIGDQFGPSPDLTGMDLNFDSGTGNYIVHLETTNTNPFVGAFRINLNLFNIDAGTTAQDPSVFQDTLNDFDLTEPSTTISLSGISSRLLSWNLGDRILLNNFPDGVPHPDQITFFRSSVVGLPFDAAFENEDMLGIEQQTAVINSTTTPSPDSDLDGVSDELDLCPNTTDAAFDDLIPSEIMSVDLSSDRIDGSDNINNQLLAGTILIFQTDAGRLGKMQITTYGYNLEFKFMTYDYDGSVFLPDDNKVVWGTWLFDLDTGALSGLR